jgi:nicotinamidase-related amidase
MHPDAWLLVIDAQRIFADPASAWGSPMFPGIVEPVRRLASRAGDRTVLTRWVAPAPAYGSWGPYLAAWPFADRPADDPLFDLVDEVAPLGRHVVTASTFGKWGPDLVALTGETPRLVLAGVSTDCCVVSTALAAADAGATVTVVTDACAGSTPANHASALAVMGLYPPQITLATTDEVLAAEILADEVPAGEVPE